jgi:damage-control phosphatase, subfamily I
MKSTLDCILCLVRQSLNVARMATSDERLHAQILREVLQRTSKMDLTQGLAFLGEWLHRIVRQTVRIEDPHADPKDASNRLALALLPVWQRRLRAELQPRLAALK